MLADPPPAVRNEQGLSRQLSSAKQTMMALGGAIGTGMFLASGLAVNVAGPALIVSYVIVAGIATLLGRALSEMAVAHPTAGAFGVYAEMYVSPFAGYAVRVSYWLMEVLATGGQLVAASIYMGLWFPGVPSAVWVLAFAVVLIYLNSREVGRLGAIESWLVMIKVVAVALFVGLGVLLYLVDTGITREDAYAIVQANAMVVWDDIQQARKGPTYRQLLEADAECTLTSAQLDEVFDPWAFLSRVGVLFARVEALEF
jgi:L-asparagine transporter-like permease